MESGYYNDLVRQYGQAYIDAGGAERFGTFDRFILSDRDEYSSAVESGMTSNSQAGEYVEVHLVLNGELGEILLDKVESAQKKREADYGSQR